MDQPSPDQQPQWQAPQQQAQAVTQQAQFAYPTQQSSGSKVPVIIGAVLGALLLIAAGVGAFLFLSGNANKALAEDIVAAAAEGDVNKILDLTDEEESSDFLDGFVRDAEGGKYELVDEDYSENEDNFRFENEGDEGSEWIELGISNPEDGEETTYDLRWDNGNEIEEPEPDTPGNYSTYNHTSRTSFCMSY